MSEQVKILSAFLAVVLAAPAIVSTYAAVTTSAEPSLTPLPAATETAPIPSVASPAPLPVAPSPTPTPDLMPLPPVPPSPEPPDQQDFVRPDEVRNILRDIKNQRRDIRGIRKTAKKVNAATVLAKLDEVEQILNVTEAALKNQPTRDALQDYWDARIWEEINPLRAQLELPKEISNIERQLKKVDRKLKQRRYKAIGEELLALLAAKAGEIRSALTQSQQLVAQGEFEEARETLQIVHEEIGPWDIESTMDRLADLYREMKRVRDKEVLAALEEFLAPVRDLIKEGDLRGARETLDEAFNELMRVVSYASSLRGAGRQRDVFDDRLEKLQELLENKLSAREQAQTQKGNSAPPSPPPPSEFK